MKNLKWIGTFFVLIGIILTNVNVFPLNIFIHGFGVIMWTLHGLLIKDNAVITNFGCQIPIFGFGIFNYFV